ncbi:hypothetical protein NJB95_12820 [Brucella intermedia]|uniref:hypothetical protein n=1 Tax=Brucella intermedia TaxID=94625 RepID=UPI00209AF892|nr:hypothetical protein [Brucella intermedia]MCO7737489.1 hypothetical protein [Brucella intermedia]
MTQPLITRLSKLEGPDREVDAEIDRAFGLLVDIYPLSGPMTDYPEPVGYTETRHYTASVDAAIALAERVLPGANRTIRKRYRTTSGHIDGHVYDAHVSGGDVSTGANEAIALLIALLRAKEASK